MMKYLAIFMLLSTAAQSREYLTADRAYYVNPSASTSAPCGPTGSRVTCSPGSDSNSGLTNTAPFQTLQRAWNVVVGTLDFGECHTVTIYGSDGTYSSGLVAVGVPPGQCDGFNLDIAGNDANPENALISTANGPAVVAGSSAGAAADFHFHGWRLRTTGTAYSGSDLETHKRGSIRIGNIDFGPSTFIQIWNHTGGFVVADPTGIYRISGGALDHIFGSENGVDSIHGITVTIAICPETGTWPSFGTFIYSGLSASVVFDGNTFVNKANLSGTKFWAEVNGNILTGTGNPNGYLPGTANGGTQLGGQVY